MGRQLPHSARRDGNLAAAIGFKRIKQSFPRATLSFRQRKLDRLGSRIEREDMPTVAPIRLGAAEGAAEAACHRVLPIPKLHFAPIRPQPNDVFEPARPCRDSLVKPAAPKIGVVCAQQNCASYERAERFVLAAEIPIDPARLIVLAIGVVVAALGAAKLVAGRQHRDSQREQQRRDEIAFLAKAQGSYRGIVTVAFQAAIPTEILIAAVGVLLAIGPIVFLGVAHRILKGETVMRRNEIDAVIPRW